MVSAEEKRRFRARHRTVLLTSLAILIAAAALSVDERGRLVVLGVPRAVVPQLCLWRRLFGADCPGCGLTRSVVLAARCHVAAAFESHRIGPVFLAVILLQIPYRLGMLFLKQDYPTSKWIDWLTVGLLMGALAGNWAWNLVF